MHKSTVRVSLLCKQSRAPSTLLRYGVVLCIPCTCFLRMTPLTTQHHGNAHPVEEAAQRAQAQVHMRLGAVQARHLPAPRARLDTRAVAVKSLS